MPARTSVLLRVGVCVAVDLVTLAVRAALR
jgi:hypothetical protein